MRRREGGGGGEGRWEPGDSREQRAPAGTGWKGGGRNHLRLHELDDPRRHGGDVDALARPDGEAGQLLAAGDDEAPHLRRLDVALGEEVLDGARPRAVGGEQHELLVLHQRGGTPLWEGEGG